MQHPTRWPRLLAIGCLLAGIALAGGVRAADESDDAAAQDELGESGAEPAPAEPSSAEPPPGVEVMRVRGRGIADILTEVPSSVTSFDAATIEALGAQNVSDLARVTPNVSIVQPGATQATFFIRGIGLSDFSSNAAGAVTIFQDDVALNAPAIQTGQLFDVEDVNIVRGPQGSGPYRNASAGAIRVRSRRPTGTYAASLRASQGWYYADDDQGAHDARFQEYEGAIEVPLVEEVLSSRVAFHLNEGDPWKTNGCGGLPPVDQRQRFPNTTAGRSMVSLCGERGGNYITLDPSTFPARLYSAVPAGLPDRVGDEHNWAARGFLRVTPRDSDWDVLLNGHGSRLDQQSTLGQAIGTDAAGNRNLGGPTSSGYVEPDAAEERRFVTQEQLEDHLTKRPLDIRPYRGDYDLVGQTTRDAWGGFVSAEGGVGDLDLSLLASYDGYTRQENQDVDFTSDQTIAVYSNDEAWQTYEQVKLGGELAAMPFSWELGGYFLFEKLKGNVPSLAGGASSTSLTVIRDFQQDTYSGGLWAGFSWDFLDDLTLEGGVRGNYERKDFDFEVFNSLANPQTLTDQPGKSWLVPTGQLILTYHLNDSAQAYARYTRGWKAGHFNSVATQRLDQLLSDPETNDAWEAGLNGSFWDGRLQASGSFFFYEYTDYQVFLFINQPQNPPTLGIVNADNTELYGLELEGRLRPLEALVPRWAERLQIGANFSWLQGQYIDFSTEQSFLSGGGFQTQVQDFSGNPLANAPKYKVSAFAEWTFDLGRYGYLIPRYDLSWTDDQYFDPSAGRGTLLSDGSSNLPPLTIAQPAFFLHNLRLAYRTSTGNVEIAGWVRNLTDEVYKSYAFDVTEFAQEVINFTGTPRTVGVDLVVTF